jgi:hypothetical protein
LVFPSRPPEREFRISGVERIETCGHQMSVQRSLPSLPIQPQLEFQWTIWL